MKTIYKKLLFLFLILPFSAFAQTLSGVVLDGSSNQPLPGVNVIVKGASNSTTTDFDGRFQLAGLKNGDVILFSFIGYTNQEINYSGQKSLSISLVEEANQLQEVVVQVGYGSVKAKDATGSITTVTTKDFNRGNNVTAENLLNGRVAGLSITTGGAPGSGSAIRIRGGASLSASNDPLIVIDGLPVDNGNSGGSTSVLAALNPNDIESFSVLKDASATAIYGSRASNGVIIITTKKGGKGDLKVSFNSLATINTLAKKVDVLSANQFRELVQQVGTPAQIALLGNANTDWQDEIFSNSISVDNNVSLRGNLFNSIPSRLSIGYTEVPGLLKTGEFNRTTASLALNPSFFDDHLKINLNANIAWQGNRFADQGAIGNAVRFDPTQSVYDPSSYLGGYFEWFEADGDRVAVGAQHNPVSLLNQRRDETDNRRIYGNVQFDYKFHFFSDLRAVLNLGIDKQTGNGHNILDPFSPAGYQTGVYSSGTYQNFGSNRYFWDKRENKLMDAYLVYTKVLDNTTLDVTGGYSYQNFESKQFNSGNIYDPSAEADIYTDPGINLQSFFARANVGFYDKYLFTLNYRRDGSSRFSEENRWGDFYGAAFAWKMENEDFLKDSKYISTMKFRLGYGLTGQQDIGSSLTYLPTYSTSTSPQAQYQFGDNFYSYGRPEGYNANLKWEETATFNVGLDFGLFNERLKGTIEYFHKKSTDLLSWVSYPDGANLDNEGWANIGDFTTKGVEFNIGYDIFKREDFKWNANFNVFYNQREITDLVRDNVPQGSIEGGGGNNIQINSMGYAPNSFYVYQQVYDVNGKPLENVFVDRNQDGIVDAKDMYRYKNPNPDYTFGFMNNITYKNFDFSMAWRASMGNYLYNNTLSKSSYLMSGIRYPDVISNLSQNYFDTEFLLEGDKTYMSDYYVEDASWIKLDNITVGYTIQNPFKDDKSRLRFYLAGQNLLIISDYKGIDPEVFGGVDNNLYPRPRMYMFGVNLDF
jgi:TonB-linked SusC/RagA family outer membrane protein